MSYKSIESITCFIHVLVYLLYLIPFPMCLILFSEGDDTEQREDFRPITSLHVVSREIENILTLSTVITLIPRIFAVIRKLSFRKLLKGVSTLLVVFANYGKTTISRVSVFYSCTTHIGLPSLALVVSGSLSVQDSHLLKKSSNLIGLF